MISVWSYSRLSDFETCPAYAFYAHSVESRYRDLRTFGPSATRGTKIHGQGEEFLQGKRKSVPSGFYYFKKDLRDLKKRKAIAEERWALTSEWAATTWSADDVWLRLAIDARVEESPETQEVIDFKTGRIYEGHADQLELYALPVFKRFPSVETVRVAAWYLDLGEIHDGEIARTEERALTKHWTKRAEKMLTATEFNPTPCWKCKFCDFAKSKGGPCEEG